MLRCMKRLSIVQCCYNITFLSSNTSFYVTSTWQAGLLLGGSLSIITYEAFCKLAYYVC
jgi:hypothetical protein